MQTSAASVGAGMFLSGSKWEELSDPNAVFEEIALKIQSPDHRAFLTQYRHNNPNPCLGGRSRPLAFYEHYKLYEIELKTEDFDRQGAYQCGSIYALMSNKAAHLLAGSGPDIHAANVNEDETLNVILNTSEQVVEYLDFFCTFVAGEDGPFLLAEQAEDFEWGARSVPDEAITTSFDIRVDERRKRFGWAANQLDLSVKDLKAFAENPQDALQAFVRKSTQQNLGARRPERLLSNLGPIKFHGSQSENGEVVSYGASATVWYGPALFEAQFVIQLNGVVEMRDDEPLGFIAQPNWSFLPSAPILGRMKHRTKMTGEEAREYVLRLATNSDQAVRTPIPLRNVRIVGDCDLSRLSISNAIELIDVEVDGTLNLENSELSGGLNLSRVRVSGQLLASGLTCRSFEAKFLEVSGLYERNAPWLVTEGHQTAGMSLSGATIDNAMTLIGATIEGGLDFTDIRCGGLCDLSGIKVDERQPNVLSSSNVSQELRGADLSRGRFESDVRLGPGGARGYGFAGGQRAASLLGGLTMINTEIRGSLFMNALKTKAGKAGEALKPDELENRLEDIAKELAGTSMETAFLPELELVLLLRDKIGSGGVDLRNTQIDGALYLAPVVLNNELQRCHIVGNLGADNLRLQGSANLWGVDIAGDVVANGAAINGAFELTMYNPARLPASVGGSFSMHRAEVKGRLIISGAKIAKSVLLDSLVLGDMLDGNNGRGARTEIGGDVRLSNANMASDVRFCGVKIGGVFQAITGTFGRIQIRANITDELDESSNEQSWKFEVPELGSVLLQSIACASLNLHGAKIEEGIEINDTEIDADFTVFSESPENYLLYGWSDPDPIRSAIPAAAEITTNLGGHFKVRRLRTGGNLDLGGLVCLQGASFDQLHVGGDLIARSGPKDRPRDNGEVFQTLIGQLSLVNAEVAGDAILDGVVIEANSHAELSLANADFRGELRFAQYESDTLYSAIVPDGVSVNLSGIEAGTLSLTGSPSFPVMDIRGARIGSLKLLGDLPGRIDLTDANVESWAFGDANNHDEDPGKALRLLLQQSTPFDPTAYIRIEHWLHRRGEKGAADEVHKDMRWRATKPRRKQDDTGAYRPGFLGGLWAAVLAGVFVTERSRSALVGIFTGFWTEGARILVWGGLPTLLLSLMIVGLPQNMAPSTMRLSESVDEMTRDQAPPAENWTHVEQARILIANHIPIATIVGTPRWELAEKRPLHVQVPFVGVQKIEFISPAAYGLFVRILHWLAWPLFLVGIAANLQRRRDVN